MTVREHKRLNTAKAGPMTWTYAEGKLSQSVDGKVVHTMTAQATLALTNLLYSNYTEIVQFTREEQRKAELEADKRKAHNITEGLSKIGKAMAAQDMV